MIQQKARWYEKIPHPVVMLFGMVILATVLSYLLPAGIFERELINGRQRVIPGSYKTMAQTPVGFLDMFVAFSKGFKAASDIIFVVLTSGIMFGILEKSRMIENAIGTIIKKLGLKNRYLIVVLMTFIFGMLGVAVGYENNIALIPIAAILSLAIGGDLILAAGMSVAAITVGFGLSPINPYTVGTGHQIAEMPMFSGALLRSGLCALGLAIVAFLNLRYFKIILKNPERGLGQDLDTEGLKLSKEISAYSMSENNWLVLTIFVGGMIAMLYGIFNFDWYLKEISAIFVAPGAFMVGYATTIKVILEMGNVSDTIAFQLSNVLTTLPTYASAILMSLSQCVMNFMIPSGSGQALATLPIMIPVGELVGLTRQTSILAFQIGDGVTNLVNPTLGGLIAMLGMCRVPFDRWLRFIFPVTIALLLLSWVFLVFSIAINWGPV